MQAHYKQITSISYCCAAYKWHAHGEQKITLNFNKLQAVASLPIICTAPQAATRLDAIRGGIQFYTVNKEKM